MITEQNCAAPTAPVDDVRDVIGLTIATYAEIRNTPLGDPYIANLATCAAAVLSAIARTHFISPREDENVEWDATPAERVMINSLIEWGSAPDDAGVTVGGLSDALAANGFAIVARPLVTDEMVETATRAVSEALGPDSFDCTRVWSAWSYGTMGPDDFVETRERSAEIARAAIEAALAKEPAR